MVVTFRLNPFAAAHAQSALRETMASAHQCCELSPNYMYAEGQPLYHNISEIIIKFTINSSFSAPSKGIVFCWVSAVPTTIGTRLCCLVRRLWGGAELEISRLPLYMMKNGDFMSIGVIPSVVAVTGPGAEGRGCDLIWAVTSGVVIVVADGVEAFIG